MDKKQENTRNNTQIIIALGIFIAILLVGISFKLIFTKTGGKEIEPVVVSTTETTTAAEKRESVKEEHTIEAMAAQPASVEEISEPDRETDAVAVNEYILPNSDNLYYTESDLRSFSREELRIARNEIYAKHGRLFKDEWLQSYFNNCSWYIGRINPDDFKEEMLNTYEKANAKLISDYETRMGYQ